MPEVAVTKTKTTAPAPSAAELFEPMLPFGRFFGLGPFALMREFTKEMDRAFRGSVPSEALEGWIPAVDVERCDGTMVVSAALPGVNKEELKVEVGDDELVIEGERKQEHKKDHNGYHRWECNYGHFYRSIPLPEGAKTDEIKAELKDGILRVRIPAPEVTTKRREIPVAV